MQGHCRQRRRGTVLIGTLFFILIISVLLMGTGQFTVSHQTRAKVDADYAAALDLAEAGVNFEFRKISVDPASADQYPGATYAAGGAFQVYCVNRDGSSPWTAPNNLYVVAAGTVSGVRRTLRVSVTGYPSPGKFAVYAINATSIANGSSITVNGDAGTNGQFRFSGSPNIQGNVYFEGGSAGWLNGNDPGGYNVVREPQPMRWLTVKEKALALFPNQGLTAPGGLDYLALKNDNAMAVPPIAGQAITDNVTLVGKPGGANYYVTSIDLNGNRKIALDNTHGPINVWVGPDGGTGKCNFRGGTAAISIAQDPSRLCTIYVATQTGINMAGSETIDAVLYAYGVDNLGQPFGIVNNNGNPVINGRIIANEIDLSGHVTINYIPNPVKPASFAYYGFDNEWYEINGR